MNTGNNVNDNAVSNFETNNVNDNDRKKRTPNQVDAIATRISRRLHGSDGNWEYYCKVGNSSMSEALIEKNLDIALKRGKNPQAYFTWLCNRYMK